LVVVGNHGYVAGWSGQKIYNLKLGKIRVLKFIHKDIFEFPPVIP